ncbi:MAG: efflux RND transporter periplasmic adaptor subunit, partial [Proteobacteria bacterium]|nr:efflux RND transporter periplasmic adaptor subunit [Pseudomonadota bacterium]
VIFDKSGLRIATVNEAGIVSLKSIKISRDLGNAIEIASGISRTDKVIESPPDDLVDGDRVLVQGETKRRAGAGIR